MRRDCLSLVFTHSKCSFFPSVLFHVTNCISPGFSERSNRPPFSSSSPWMWNFSKCSPKPQVSFCPHPFSCLSPVYVEIHFLVRKSGKIYYSENSVFVLLKKTQFLSHCQPPCHIICTYFLIFFRIPLRETPICSSLTAL